MHLIEVELGEWKEENEKQCRESTYIKYLGSTIGPKTTKCYLKEEILHLDLNDYITQLTVTQTPDVPSGGSFNVKTKTCISYAAQGKVRVLVTVFVEFTKSSWLKCKVISLFRLFVCLFLFLSLLVCICLFIYLFA
jgi:hypothetical protein